MFAHERIASYTKNMLQPDAVSANAALARALQFVTDALQYMEVFDDEVLLEDLLDVQKGMLDVSLAVTAKVASGEEPQWGCTCGECGDSDDFED